MYCWSRTEMFLAHSQLVYLLKSQICYIWYPDGQDGNNFGFNFQIDNGRRKLTLISLWMLMCQDPGFVFFLFVCFLHNAGSGVWGSMEIVWKDLILQTRYCFCPKLVSWPYISQFSASLLDYLLPKRWCGQETPSKISLSPLFLWSKEDCAIFRIYGASRVCRQVGVIFCRAAGNFGENYHL